MIDTATILQIVRIAFMLGGSAITAKTGVDLAQAEGLIGALVAAGGAVWSLYSGVKARANSRN